MIRYPEEQPGLFEMNKRGKVILDFSPLNLNLESFDKRVEVILDFIPLFHPLTLSYLLYECIGKGPCWIQGF